MIRFFFKPRLNVFDAILISTASHAISDHHFLAATAICLIGGAFSAYMERRCS